MASASTYNPKAAYDTIGTATSIPRSNANYVRIWTGWKTNSKCTAGRTSDTLDDADSVSDAI
jgi:hypothetical protein